MLSSKWLRKKQNKQVSNFRSIDRCDHVHPTGSATVINLWLFESDETRGAIRFYCIQVNSMISELHGRRRVCLGKTSPLAGKSTFVGKKTEF